MLLVKLLFRNAFRHKLRTFLTVLGITVAILAFGLLRTVIDAWYAGVTASSSYRLIVRNSISLVFPLPISYLEKIRHVQGVKRVSYGSWFGGVYKEEKNFFANFTVQPETYLDIYPEFMLPPDQKQAFMKDRHSAVAGRQLVERYGWKIGDMITLKGTIYPGEWSFVLKGIYRGRDKDTDESQLFFHWNYLNEGIKKTKPLRADQVGFFLVQIKNPDDAAQVSRDIDRLFKNSLAETMTETERAFQMSFVSMTEAIIAVIQIVSLIVIIIIMAVMANTMAMSVRERTGEYGVFKTLGFTVRHIAFLIFGESMVITFTGCLFGIILTYPAAGIFTSQLGEYFPIFHVSAETIYLDIAAAFMVAFISALIPTYRAATISIVSALRRIG